MNYFNLILPVLLLTGCAKSEPKEPMHNYHETKDCLIPWTDIFEQVEDDYLVYFYSERCGYCNEIKQDVLSFYLELKPVMYFVCTDLDAIFGPSKDLKGIDNIDDFYIFGTPFLLRVYTHQVEDYYVGKNQILDYINLFS